jgi:energy-coupling factor transporter ATP-binding protein EcfA2
LELVYLWVEDNLLIKGKEFNFGSKYIFSYNEESRILSKKDNPNYIEGLYENNITISAIVGKNGSGKTELLKLIWNTISDKKYFCIYKIEDDYILFKDTSLSIKLPSNISCETKSNYPKNLTNLFYTNEAICLDDTETSKFISMECYLKNIIDMNSGFVEEIKEASHDEGTTYHQEAEGNAEEGLTQDEKTETIFNGDSPIPHIVDNLNKIYTYSNIKEALHTKIFEQIFNLIYDANIKWFNDFKKPNSLEIFRNEYNYRNNFIYDIKDIGITDNLLVNFFSIIEWNINFGSDKNKKITDILKNYRVALSSNERKNILKQRKLFLEEIEKTDFEHLIVHLTNMYKNLVELENKNPDLSIELNDVNKNLIKSFLKNYSFLLENIPKSDAILHFSLEPKMSSGHFIIIQTFAMLYEKINKIEDENILLLLDEVELFLHPDWQKKFLSLLISFLKSKFKNKNFHIILATHSPFLLSDIPKSNVVFLDDKEVKIEQTFGANIHTLLSDSFFMNDGLMGEFAKSKITEIKEFYQKVEEKKKSDFISLKKEYEKKKTKFEEIQSIIGEPFLKRVIKNYLDDLEIIFSDDNTLIEKELAEIEKRRVYLEGLKNDKT